MVHLWAGGVFEQAVRQAWGRRILSIKGCQRVVLWEESAGKIWVLGWEF